LKGLKNIGAYMQAKREAAWMSYGTLADITRISVEQIVLIEQGDPSCSFECLVRLAWWFRVKIMTRVVDK
jgi:predicted transcriptional regulator